MLDILMSAAQEISPAIYSSAKWALDWNQMDEMDIVQYLVNNLMA